MNQASEKIPVGKIIFHKGKASLSVIISVIWFSMWCTAGLGYLSEGSAAWGQGWELCRADVPQIPGPGGRMAVHGQHDMEACLEWLQMEPAPLPSYPHLLSQCDMLVTVPHG